MAVRHGPKPSLRAALVLLLLATPAGLVLADDRGSVLGAAAWIAFSGAYFLLGFNENRSWALAVPLLVLLAYAAISGVAGCVSAFEEPRGFERCAQGGGFSVAISSVVGVVLMLWAYGMAFVGRGSEKALRRRRGPHARAAS